MTRMGKDDVPVNRYQLEDLRRKAKAHDAYLWAAKRMADKQRSVSESFSSGVGSLGFVLGYRSALMDFSELVQQAPPTTE